jgi:hypothetical protein
MDCKECPHNLKANCLSEDCPKGIRTWQAHPKLSQPEIANLKFWADLNGYQVQVKS